MKKSRFLIMLLVLISLTTGLVFADNIARGDKIAIGKDIVIDKDTSLRGEIVSIFSDVKVDGKVDGEVLSIFGDIEVNGIIDGNALTVFGRIEMGKNAIITQDKVQIIGGSYDRPSTATVRGEELTIIPFKTNMPGIAILILFIMIILVIKSLVAFLLSLLLVALLPEKMERATNQMGNEVWKKLGLGILSVVIFYAASSLLGMVVIGLPLIPILGIAYWMLGFAGNTIVKLAIGRRVGRGKSGSNITQLVLGSLIFLLADLTIILKPVLYIAKLIGMGSLIDTKIGTVDYWGQNTNKNYNNNNNISNNLIENNNKDNENN